MLVHYVTTMTVPHARYRVVARHNLLAEARANPTLHDRFEAIRAGFVALIQARLSATGHPACRTTAELCVIVMDGLVNRQVFFPDSALSDTELRTVLDTMTSGTANQATEPPTGSPMA
ncbi:hypothetical protein ACWIGI_41505 [Nocardia sp. NPDC055321]